jgi:hypothetical protein
VQLRIVIRTVRGGLPRTAFMSLTLSLRPLIEKLTVVEEPEFARRYPAESCTRIEVTTTERAAREGGDALPQGTPPQIAGPAGSVVCGYHSHFARSSNFMKFRLGLWAARTDSRYRAKSASRFRPTIKPRTLRRRPTAAR